MMKAKTVESLEYELLQLQVEFMRYIVKNIGVLITVLLLYTALKLIVMMTLVDVNSKHNKHANASIMVPTTLQQIRF